MPYAILFAKSEVKSIRESATYVKLVDAGNRPGILVLKVDNETDHIYSLMRALNKLEKEGWQPVLFLGEDSLGHTQFLIRRPLEE